MNNATRPRVPAHVVHGPSLGGTATFKLDPGIRIPSLDEVWTFAPPADFSEAPDQNQEYYDRGPAVRIGYGR
jgi:hypothetical protein